MLGLLGEQLWFLRSPGWGSWVALDTVSGLGKEFWPHRRNPSPTQKEGFPAPSSYREQGSQHTGRSRGPCDVVGTGETGAGGRQSGRSPGERLEVEHVRFSFSASTVAAGCVGAGISQLDTRSGAARAGDTVGQGDTIPRKKKTILNPKLSLGLGVRTSKAGFPLFGKGRGWFTIDNFLPSLTVWNLLT